MGLQLLHSVEIDRDVVADRRMRAGASLHAADSLWRQRAGTDQEVGVFSRVDVVGDDGHVHTVTQPAAEGVDQRCLARTHRPADTKSDGAHEMNSLENWWSCRMPARSSQG